MLLGIASMLSQLTLTENNSLSHTNKDNKIKNMTLSFMVAISNETQKDSSNENRSETINNIPDSMLLTFAELDHKKSTTLKDDDKLKKMKSKTKVKLC